MIEYLEIVNKIKDVKDDAILNFNEKVSIPMVISNLDSVIKKDDENIIIEKGNKIITIDKSDRKAFYEVLFILKKINIELYNKIDFNYIDFFEKFKLKECEFDSNEKFEDIKFSLLTLQILAMLNIKFWCENDDEKKEFLDNMKDNTYIKENEEKLKNKENNNKTYIEEIEDKKDNAKLIKNNWWINLLNKLRKLKK